MEDHVDFAHEKLLGPFGRQKLSDMWEHLTKSLNAMGGTVKDSNQWKIMWKDSIRRAKDIVTASKNKYAVTGNTMEKLEKEFHRFISEFFL